MLPSKERSLFSARWREEVALGTKVAGKRVASKCIRQICILDPWHNNTRVLNNAIQSETLHAIIWKKKKNNIGHTVIQIMIRTRNEAFSSARLFLTYGQPFCNVKSSSKIGRRQHVSTSAQSRHIGMKMTEMVLYNIVPRHCRRTFLYYKCKNRNENHRNNKKNKAIRANRATRRARLQ